MASLYHILLGIIVGFCAIFGIGISISAYLRHRVKKTPMTKNLLLLFSNVSLAIILTFVTTFFAVPSLLNEQNVQTLFPVTNIHETLIILVFTFFLNFAGLFMLFGIYYMCMFAWSVFIEGVQEGISRLVIKIVRIAIAFLVSIELLVGILLLYSIFGLIINSTLDPDLLILSAFNLPRLIGFSD